MNAYNSLIGQIIFFLPRLGTGLLVFIGFWAVAAVLQSAIVAMGKRAAHFPPNVLFFIGRTVKIGLLLFGGVTALGTFGIDVSALIAGLGLVGFALGFALRDIISNLLSGILVLMYRPFRMDDFVSVSGLEGRVTGIDLRYTTLVAEDKEILVPNSMLFTNPITVSRKENKK